MSEADVSVLVVALAVRPAMRQNAPVMRRSVSRSTRRARVLMQDSSDSAHSLRLRRAIFVSEIVSCELERGRFQGAPSELPAVLGPHVLNSGRYQTTKRNCLRQPGPQRVENGKSGALVRASESRGIGEGPPSRMACRNASTSSWCPLPGSLSMRREPPA